MKIVKIVVHKFTLGDVEDPDLYAGQPLNDWSKTEAGKWITEHSVDEPEWHRSFDLSLYGYKYQIVAKLKEEDATYYNLKWGIK